MKKRKFKIKSIILFIIVLILCFGIIKFNDNSNDVVKKVSDDIDNSLESRLKKEKYYIDSNLERYLAYYEKNDIKLDKVIASVNSNLDKEKYVDVEKSNIDDGNLILVNKYYYLTDDYVPKDLTVLTSKYNTGKNSSMRKEAALAFMEMSDAATLDNVIIKNASAYRSYQYQVNLYDAYVQRDGKQAADTYSARPGFSEHQTGLATDINQIDSGFENTDAFRWLSKNAYKYGFILRFPRDKEDITGYEYESWHYRYVGKDVAKIIYDEDITLEEYYAYYIKK